MSDLRQAALAGAIQVGGDGATVMMNAATFLAFLEGAPPPPAEKPKAEKPKAEKVNAVPKQEPKPEPAVDEGPTQETVAKVIDDLLHANLRAQTIDLLAKFKAKNASGVKPGDRAAFIKAAGELLLAA
jgi:hypothetical protein